MKIRLGTNVFSEDGDKVGIVKAAIVDPASRNVTHLVLQEGLLFRQDCLLPIDCVESSSDEAICLNRSASDLHELINNYQDTDFITIAEQKDTVPEKTWNHPHGLPRSIIPPGITPGELSADVSIPINDVALVHGANVQSHDGNIVGKVIEIFTDEKESITHMLIKTSGIYGETKRIPIDWIESIDENTVQLVVSPTTIKEMVDTEDS